MTKILIIIVLISSSLLARERPSILPIRTPTQRAVDNINFVQGRVLRQQVYQERYEVQQANIKKRNEYLKKQEELKKQKRIDANEAARLKNEEYYKSQETDEFEDNSEEDSLIIKTTTIKEKNSTH